MSLKVGSLVNCDGRGSVFYRITSICGDVAKICMWSGSEESEPIRRLRLASKYPLKQRIDQLIQELNFLGVKIDTYSREV